MNLTPEQRAELLRQDAQQMTMADIDKALENKEITEREAELARFSLRAQAYGKRFKTAAGITK